MKKYFVGLDLGQASDYTAISVVEVHPTIYTIQYDGIDPEFRRPTTFTKEAAGVPVAHHVRHLERLPIGTAYPDAVARVKDLLQRLPAGTELIADHTGVGRAVTDMLFREGLTPVCVTITGGDTVHRDGLYFRVPKRDIVSALAVALQNKRLKIAAALPDTETLIAELLNFKIKVNLKTAHDSYEAWREGDHDDLVLSVGMAVWAADWLFSRANINDLLDYETEPVEISPV
mgnify:CR=1 FL=1